MASLHRTRSPSSGRGGPPARARDRERRRPSWTAGWRDLATSPRRRRCSRPRPAWNFPSRPRRFEATRGVCTLSRDQRAHCRAAADGARDSLCRVACRLAEAWLVVPLRHLDGTVGSSVLRHPPGAANARLGGLGLAADDRRRRQAASYLAEQGPPSRPLPTRAASASAFNRRFAFVVQTTSRTW